MTRQDRTNVLFCLKLALGVIAAFAVITIGFDALIKWVMK